jgi:hypothetical protein
LTRRIRRAVFIALLILIAFAFPWGPLFPWSPWKPGYESREGARASLVYPAGSQIPPGLEHLDDVVGEAEQFHRVEAPRRIRVILCRDWSDFNRFMPTVRGRAVAGVTLETGTVIYLTPKIAERDFDYGEFLRHEMSHAVLHQNQSLLQAHANKKAPWFFEGLAVSFGRQKSYVTPQEFVAFATARQLTPIIDPARVKPNLPVDMRFNYQAWRYFLEYLIDTQGRDNFQQLLVAMLRDPGASEQNYRSVYGRPMPDAIVDFESAVRAREWVPRP